MPLIDSSRKVSMASTSEVSIFFVNTNSPSIS